MRPRINRQTIKHIAMLIFAIFSAELLIMVALYLIPEIPVYQAIIFDSVCLVIVLIPAILLFVVLPLQKQIDKRKQTITELNKAHVEVRVLKGLLNICFVCKKIHTKEDNWIQLESYIQNNSEVTFSHGICQDCIKKQYPKYSLKGH